MKLISDIDIKGKRVFIRVDFNVPIKDGEVAEESRLKASLPTINYAQKKGAKIILASHLGRPKGKKDLNFSLKPVAKALGALVGKDVLFSPDCIGSEPQKLIEQMKEGDILLLENVRFYPEETQNDPKFAQELAKLADVYINDAFSVSHRAHASVVGIVKYVDEYGAGFALAREIENLSRLIFTPPKPVAALIGGVKISTKIGVLLNLLPRIEKLLIGGAMANTFLKALGLEIGQSFYEEAYLSKASEILSEAQHRGVKVYLPVDLVIAEEGGIKGEVVSVGQVPPHMVIYDLGPETIKLFSSALQGLGTILFNGPLGLFEKEAFASGTIELSRVVAASNALTIGGGGDTLRALKKAGVRNAFSYLSMAGGAFLKFLEGKSLPGIAVLEN